MCISFAATHSYSVMLPCLGDRYQNTQDGVCELPSWDMGLPPVLRVRILCKELDLNEQFTVSFLSGGRLPFPLYLFAFVNEAKGVLSYYVKYPYN